MNNYVKYSDLIKQGTEYARRMQRLSNRIFGEPARPTNVKSMRVVQLFSEEPINMKRRLTHYYPRHVETGLLMMKLRYYGLFRDEHEDFKEEMERMRVLRGKAKHIRKPKQEK